MSDRDDVLAMPAGRELDVKVAEALGFTPMTQEAMREEALAVWEHQPHVQVFNAGFKAFPANEEAIHRGFDPIARPEDVTFAPDVSPYSTSGDEAVALAQRFRLHLQPYSDGGYGARGSSQRAFGMGGGDTIPHAVARWVARYVVNGEVSDG